MRVSVCVRVWVCGCQNVCVRVLASVCAIVGACEWVRVWVQVCVYG